MSWSLEVNSREKLDPRPVERLVRVLSSLILGRSLDVQVKEVEDRNPNSLMEAPFQWEVGIGPEPLAIMIHGGRFGKDIDWGEDLIGWWGYSIGNWTAPNPDQLLTIVLLGIAIATLGDGTLAGGDFGQPVEFIRPDEIAREPWFSGHQGIGQALRSLGFDEGRIASFYGWTERYTAGLSDADRVELAAAADVARGHLTTRSSGVNVAPNAIDPGPAAVIQAIEVAVDALRSRPDRSDPDESNETVRELAALFGEQICRAYSWNWCRLHWNVVSQNGDYHDRFDALAVADPELALVLRPERFLREQLALPANQPLRIVEHFASLAERARATHFPDATRGALVVAE